MLYKEYEDADELIRMLQMRSPEVDNEGYASGGNKGFDDIYLIYERQKVNYQKEIRQNMLQIMDSIDRIKHVYLYYLQLPQKEQSVLKAKEPLSTVTAPSSHSILFSTSQYLTIIFPLLNDLFYRPFS